VFQLGKRRMLRNFNADEASRCRGDQRGMYVSSDYKEGLGEDHVESMSYWKVGRVTLTQKRLGKARGEGKLLFDLLNFIIPQLPTWHKANIHW